MKKIIGFAVIAGLALGLWIGPFWAKDLADHPIFSASDG